MVVSELMQVELFCVEQEASPPSVPLQYSYLLLCCVDAAVLPSAVTRQDIESRARRAKTLSPGQEGQRRAGQGRQG